MRVYRIAKTEYIKDVSGYGAKIFGGRWININTACIYTSQSIALATLEFYANVNKIFVHFDLSLIEIEIKDSEIIHFEINELPEEWQSIPFVKTTQDFGSDFFHNNTKAMSVPSSVIPQERNIIIHPTLFLNKKAKIVKTQPLHLDKRISNKFTK